MSKKFKCCLTCKWYSTMCNTKTCTRHDNCIEALGNLVNKGSVRDKNDCEYWEKKEYVYNG